MQSFSHPPYLLLVMVHQPEGVVGVCNKPDLKKNGRHIGFPENLVIGDPDVTPRTDTFLQGWKNTVGGFMRSGSFPVYKGTGTFRPFGFPCVGMNADEKVCLHFVGIPDPLPERYLPALRWTFVRKYSIETKASQFCNENFCPGIHYVYFPDETDRTGITTTIQWPGSIAIKNPDFILPPSFLKNKGGSQSPRQSIPRTSFPLSPRNCYERDVDLAGVGCDYLEHIPYRIRCGSFVAPELYRADISFARNQRRYEL